MNKWGCIYGVHLDPEIHIRRYEMLDYNFNCYDYSWDYTNTFLDKIDNFIESEEIRNLKITGHEIRVISNDDTGLHGQIIIKFDVKE